MKKILYLITHNDNGGAQDALYKFANLEINEFSTEIFALYSVNRKSKINSFTKCEYPIIRNIMGVVSFICYLLKNRPNVVVSFLPFANVVNGVFSVFFKYKSVISHRNPVWTYSFLMRNADRVCSYFSLYDRVMCNSKSVAESLERYSLSEKAKIVVVNNFVNNESAVYSKCELEEIIGIKLDEKFAVAIGRLSKQKRFDILIDAVQDLDIQLVVAGDGELRDVYQSKVGDGSKVKFIGQVDNMIVKSLLKHCHLYLQPSEYEGQSNSLLEAIQFDCIIVSSNIPSQREVLSVNGRVGGVMVDSFKVDIWREQIEYYSRCSENYFLNDLKYLREFYSPAAAKLSIQKMLQGIVISE